MKRTAFRMKLNKGFADEYKRRHDEIWPELEALLRKYGVEDYSIFLDSDNGDLFGVLQAQDPDRLKTIGSEPVMKKWWAFMKDMMETNDDGSPVSIDLKEVFHLP